MEKVAVVTGASRGIGRAIAERFKREGIEVAALDIEPADGFFVKCNVADTRDVSSAFKKIIDAFGRVDILVNNAGITKDSLAVRMRPEDWQRVLDVNLTGAFYCAQEALKPMVKQKKGVIINIASVIGIIGNPGQANYSASKAGLIALTKTLAKEVASRNIRVNAIAPGFVDTDMTKKLSENIKSEILTRIPLKRFGRPEEIAELVSFLIEADYITGQVIVIDGGLLI
jgi:3-oxoacyl-[acyl-carrier protein] reductase